jgi:hypothetical protein
VRLGGRAVARPDYYDRNPVQKIYSFETVEEPPHAATDRISYTCPSGKKAMVELLHMELTRWTAATTLNWAEVFCLLKPSGGDLEELCHIYFYSNTPNDSKTWDSGTPILLLPGDQIVLGTCDESTGGSFHYNLSAKIVEFEA